MKHLLVAMVLGLFLFGSSGALAAPKEGKSPAAKVINANKTKTRQAVKFQKGKELDKKIKKATNKSTVPTKSPKKKPHQPQKPVMPKVVCLKNPTVPADKLDVSERICQAKKLLSGQTADAGYCESGIQVCKGKGKKRRCSTKLKRYFCRQSILLASMDAKNGRIKIVEMNTTGRPSVPGYSIRQLTRDGVDSEYDIRSPPGQLVIGIQFPLLLRTSRGVIVERAIYTPYTRELREAYPELISLGWKYLVNGLTAAREKVEAAEVDLDYIDPFVVFALVMVEHFTNEESSDIEVEEEMYRVALTIGANGPAAYRYSVSSTGARGVGQFMPRTWKSLRLRYPLLLTQEFFSGSANHDQTFIAQHLLAKEDMDFLLSQRFWRDQTRRAELLSNPCLVGEYLALSYNGGASRAHRWLASNKTLALPSEGAKYVRKFKQVYGVLKRLETE